MSGCFSIALILSFSVLNYCNSCVDSIQAFINDVHACIQEINASFIRVQIFLCHSFDSLMCCCPGDQTMNPYAEMSFL